MRRNYRYLVVALLLIAIALFILFVSLDPFPWKEMPR